MKMMIESKAKYDNISTKLKYTKLRKGYSDNPLKGYNAKQDSSLFMVMRQASVLVHSSGFLTQSQSISGKFLHKDDIESANVNPDPRWQSGKWSSKDRPCHLCCYHQ